MDNSRRKKIVMRHRDRLHQVPIYLGKMLRSFVFMSDWKMLPMSAVIAALVCMVVRRTYFLTMDGTLKGSFAFCCVAIWNGCFNSIQVICRERPIVKREHRSGMHITSYMAAHMIYQALLCAAQTVITIGVSALCGVHFPTTGFMTPFFKLDIGVTIFLIAYASDMLSLLISAIAHSTTAAMTVMPFILIFQLVFSGGFFALPQWAEHFTDISISNYGLTCLNAQANYNELPMTAAWTALTRMEDSEISGSVTVGQILDAASDPVGLFKNIRSEVIDLNKMAASALDTAGLPDENLEVTVDHPNATLLDDYPESEEEEIATEVDKAPEETEEATAEAPAEEAAAQSGETAAEAPAEEAAAQSGEATAEAPAEEAAAQSGEAAAEAGETAESGNATFTVGELIDDLSKSGMVEQYRDLQIPYSIRISEIIDYYGRDKLKDEIETRSAESMADSNYAQTKGNILTLWIVLFAFALSYALIGTIILEFIDKDKR